MEFEFVDVSAADLPAVLQLNESEVPHLGTVDLRQLEWFAKHANYFRVALYEACLLYTSDAADDYFWV